MALSTELIAAIQNASSALSTNTDGELILPERKQIWRAMGDLLVEGNRAIKGIGLKRRTKLARFCVQKVLALWDEVWPYDDGPRQMLITADQYLNGAIDYDVAWERKNTYWSKLDNLIYEGNHLTIVNPQDPDENIRDESLDPYQWDASLYASAAYAGGFAWEEQSNKLRRREFWQWYLIEAVPSAWEA